MKVELSEQDLQNLIVLISRAQVVGEEQEVAVMLKMRLRQALQPTPQPDGARPEEEIPAAPAEEATS